jgi:hypothetical protein
MRTSRTPQKEGGATLVLKPSIIVSNNDSHAAGSSDASIYGDYEAARTSLLAPPGRTTRVAGEAGPGGRTSPMTSHARGAPQICWCSLSNARKVQASKPNTSLRKLPEAPKPPRIANSNISTDNTLPQTFVHLAQKWRMYASVKPQRLLRFTCESMRNNPYNRGIQYSGFVIFSSLAQTSQYTTFILEAEGRGKIWKTDRHSHYN